MAFGRCVPSACSFVPLLPMCRTAHVPLSRSDQSHLRQEPKTSAAATLPLTEGAATTLTIASFTQQDKMPPRASTSAAALDHSDDDFIVADDADDSGDDFMDSPPPSGNARNFAASSSRARAGAGAKGAAAGKGAAASAAAARKSALGAKGSKDASRSYAWEQTFQRSWDVVNEDESGSLEASVKHLLAAGKRRRAAKEERRVRRGIIRHLVLVLDDSENMNEKDGGRGTR